MRHASHSFFMDVRTCSRGASSSRRSSVVSRSFGRSGRRFARARLRRRLASRRARSATQCHRSREKRTFMVDSSSPSVARRSRRRVTRGAPIFDVARARRHSFERVVVVGARGTDRRPRRRRRVEWVNGPRECVSLRETSQRRAAQPAEEAENSHDDGNRGGVSNVGTRGRWIDARSSDARGGTAREGDECVGVERARRRRCGGSRRRDDDGARGERRGVVEKFGGERRVGSQGEAEERFIRR